MGQVIWPWNRDLLEPSLELYGALAPTAREEETVRDLLATHSDRMLALCREVARDTTVCEIESESVTLRLTPGVEEREEECQATASVPHTRGASEERRSRKRGVRTGEEQTNVSLFLIFHCSDYRAPHQAPSTHCLLSEKWPSQSHPRLGSGVGG